VFPTVTCVAWLAAWLSCSGKRRRWRRGWVEKLRQEEEERLHLLSKTDQAIAN